MVTMKSSWAMKVVVMMIKRRSLCTAVTAKVTATRWERVKNSRAGVWCRTVVTDYKEACREVVVGAWERPLKALTYLGLLGGASACAYTNPGEDSLRTAFLESSNQLGLLSPWIRNGASDGHVQSLTKLHNEGRLRHLSLGVASLAWRADYDPAVSLYEASCSNLTVPWRELPQRVLDVGFAGRWWMLDKKMKDYDINEEEFKSLPTHMQATLPPTVQEVERSEMLHKASWLPLKMEEEVAELKESSQDAAVLPEIVEEEELKESSQDAAIVPEIVEEEEQKESSAQ